MTESAASRQRGSVRRLRDRWQMRVSAGVDPVSGERIILTESVVIERPGNSRSERAALKEAEKRRTKVARGRRRATGRADADDRRSSRRAVDEPARDRLDHPDDLRGFKSCQRRSKVDPLSPFSIDRRSTGEQRRCQ